MKAVDSLKQNVEQMELAILFTMDSKQKNRYNCFPVIPDHNFWLFAGNVFFMNTYK